MRGPGETQLETDRRLARTRIALLRRRLRETRSSAALMRRKRRDAQRGAVRRARRLHQRRQVDAAERAHGRRGVDRQPPLRDARPDHARVRPPRAHVHASPTPSASSASCRTASSRRSRPRWRRRSPATCCCSWPTPARRRRSAPRSSGRSRRCWSRSAPTTCRASLVLNKADLVRPDERRRLRNANPDAVLVSARTGEGLDALEERIAAFFAERYRADRAAGAARRRPRLADLYALGAPIEAREDTAVGVRIRAHLLGGRGAPLRPLSRERLRPRVTALPGAAAGRARRRARPRARRRRRARPRRRRAAGARPGRARVGRHRARDRAAAGPRGPGGAALRASPRATASRCSNAPGPDRRRLPRRGARAARQHRPRHGRTASSRATASRSSSSCPSPTALPVLAERLGDSARGEGGFGSTGRR